MNSLLTWISVHSVLNSAPNVVYPNFEVNGSTPPWQHELLAEFYSEGGKNPGHDAVNFYEVFRNYLTATPGWVDIARWIGSLIGLVLWYTAESLEFMYVKLFGLMKISNISDYAAKAQYLGGHFGIHDLFVDANDFGLIVFSIVLLIYVIGTIINNPTYQRYKNILRNTCLILFFLFCLPFMTSEFGQGVNDIAQGMFGNQVASTSTTSNNAQSTAHESSLANLAFYNNTVSIPTRIESTVPGQSIFDDTDGSGHEIYQLGGSSQSASPIDGLDSNADPIMIDLTEMSFTQKDRWNGLGSESIPQFLLDYASPSESMDTNSLSEYATTASQIMAEKSEPGASSGLKRRAHEALLKNAESPLTRGSGTNTDISGHPLLSGGINLINEVNPVDIGWRVASAIGADFTQDKYESNFKTLFEYHVADAGPGVGESSASKGLTSHDVGNFDSSFSKVFARSYNFYHVSWMAVYAQLVMIILILGEYTIKIFQMMFKLVVMYISSGLILLRNADNYQRIKNWMRDLFSIYEMAIMDIIMVYVSLYIIYPAYHEFDDHILVTTNNAYLANPYSITLLNLIGDLALFGCAAKGLNSVDRAVGSSGGGANSGTSGVFKSAIALTAAHGAMNVGTSLASGAWGLGKKGIKGAYKKGKANVAGHLFGGAKGKKSAQNDAKKRGRSAAATSQRPHGKSGYGKNADKAAQKHNMQNAAAKKNHKNGLGKKSTSAKGGKGSNPKMGNAAKDQLGNNGFGTDDSTNDGTSDDSGGADDGADDSDSGDDSGQNDDQGGSLDDDGDGYQSTAKQDYAQNYGQAAAEAAFDHNSAAEDYGNKYGMTAQAQTFGDHQDTTDGGTAMNADTSNGVTVYSPKHSSGAGFSGPQGSNNGGPHGPNNGGPSGLGASSTGGNGTTDGDAGQQNFINSDNPSGNFGGDDTTTTDDDSSQSTAVSPGSTPNNQFTPQGINADDGGGQDVTQGTGATGGQGITQNYDNGLNQGQSFDAYGGGNTGGITNDGGFQPSGDNATGGYTPSNDGDGITGNYGSDSVVGGGFTPDDTNANLSGNGGPAPTNADANIAVNHHNGYQAPDLPKEGSKPATQGVIDNYDIPLHQNTDGSLHDELGHVFTKQQGYGHPLEAQVPVRPSAPSKPSKGIQNPK